jgi:hypothetical protein
VRRSVLVLLAAAALLPWAAAATGGPASPLTEEDRRLFTWFDGIGLPSCASKPYVRVEWVRDGASATVPAAEDVWVVDGFVVAEDGDRMTLLDGDLWPRKLTRTPGRGWKGGVRKLELRVVVATALARLKAMATDPGAVEAMDEIYSGVRLRFGDEAQTAALARHASENGLEREAHALLDAVRALPPIPGQAAAPFDQVVARQLDEGVLWRVLFDVADADIPRARLLERLRGWRTSFPASPHLARADAVLEVLPAMVEEDAARRPVSDADLERLSPAAQAKELVYRLRDQPGDVRMGRHERVTFDLGPETSPARRLLALGPDAAPALVAAVTDARLTRAVLFIQDTAFRRIVVARVGDLARVILEAIAKDEFWDVPPDEPSMFQHAAAAEVAERCRAWLASTAAAPAGAPK